MERIKYTNEEKFNALVIVKQLVNNAVELNDYLYSGDKDTRFEAATIIFHKHGLASFYELNKEDREKYWNLYEDEINEQFHKLVGDWKEEQKFYNKMLGFIDFNIETIE